MGIKYSICVSVKIKAFTVTDRQNNDVEWVSFILCIL